MATDSEISAFENFKFNIGDMVIHVTDDKHNAQRGIIVSRSLVQFTGGTERQYCVSFRASDAIAEEIELELYQRPLRP